MDLAEEQRGRSSGAEQERAQAFGSFARAFERMVAWQVELGDRNEALAAMERARARQLLEQLELRGVDLLAGIPAADAERLIQREADASRLTGIEGKLNELRDRTDLSAAERRKQAEPIEADLAAARQACLDAYRDVRSAARPTGWPSARITSPSPCPSCRNGSPNPVRLFLEYLVGDEGVYVLVVPPNGATARLEKLALDQAQARGWASSPGP